MKPTLAMASALLLGVAHSPLSLSAADPAQATVYFGTYTNGKSKGIYTAKLDLRTGQLTPPELAGEARNPSFLAIHPNRRFLYAVSEISDFDGQKSGAVAAFAIEKASGKLTLLNQQPSGGDGPCHVTVDHTGKNVLIANYGGGSCAVLPIQADGRLDRVTSFMQHQGTSVNKERQEGPHAHGIYLDLHDRFAFVPDLGLDKVFVYKFDPAQGSLLANDPPFAPVAPGSGPRHLGLHPSGQFAYVINEMLCSITAFSYDGERGQLRNLQTVSTLPAGEALLLSYSTAEIEVHPTGRFVYGSNRGHNTIAVFTVDQTTGKLTPVQQVSTQGKIPRGFGIDPSGQFLVAANQDSDNAVAFRIDAATGRLSAVGQSVSVGAPVCVRFLPTPSP